MKTAYSYSKDCQANCSHLQQGSCRPCVEKVLESYAQESVKEYCETRDQMRDIKCHSEGFSEAREMAIEICVERRGRAGLHIGYDAGTIIGIEDIIRRIQPSAATEETK